MQGRPVGQGKLVRPHGQAAPLLGTTDAPLDSVALFVCLGVEGGRAASIATSPQPVSDLIRRLRNDGTDPALTKMSADRAGGIRAIRQDGLRSSPRPAGSATRNLDARYDGFESWRITGLTGSDHLIREVRAGMAYRLLVAWRPGLMSGAG